MSFEVQENLLLSLLFEKKLREKFINNPARFLQSYELSEDERNDFLHIRADGLEFDANLRCDLILSQITRYFPLSFSLLSSYHTLESLSQLVDSEYINTAPVDRIIHFGLRLRHLLAGVVYESQREHAVIQAIFEAELAMVFIASQLKKASLEGSNVVAQNNEIPKQWLNMAVSLAPYVSASILSLPYTELKKALCAFDSVELWRYLQATPTSVAVRKQLLQISNARFLLSQAFIRWSSKCDPVVEFNTIELSEGFAPLFQYVNGEYSIADILFQLQQAGADEAMLQSIQSTFLQLLEKGMLVLN
jgi:hypothetical protein